MASSHNPWLVLLSIVVATMASYVTLELAGAVAPHRRAPRQRLWIALGALAIGTGIWSMHFIGMLGFMLPVAVSYDVPLTLLSLAIAIVASGGGLTLANRGTRGLRWLAGGGILIGVAIAAMHYTGMAALRMDPPIRYASVLVAFSIAIAIAASVIALFAAFTLRMESLGSAFWKKAGSAFIMGSAIYGMHYTGMAAAQFAPDCVSRASPHELDHVTFAVILGAFTLVFLAGTLLVSAFEAYRASGEVDRLSQRLMELQDNERRALAAELHDIVGQSLSALNAELALIRSRLPGDAETAQRIASASSLAKSSVEAIRTVMTRLRPPGADELGLPAALRWHAAALEPRSGIPVSVAVDEALPRPSPRVEDALLRIYLEALNNVLKHSGARQVRVALERRGGDIVLGVADDGRGFRLDALARAGEEGGWGLMIMRERAAAIGGDLRVHSAPGSGTRIELMLSKDRWS
ncbi:MAG TPA: MHYT domain-containing protein [Burkholderiales bacterium]|nr:MHYT domain-containing protein [Burkholderiales bacterium]